ncbi:MAG TPA: hypothetical protein VII97_14525 [Anaerolineales bacterium]
MRPVAITGIGQTVIDEYWEKSIRDIVAEASINVVHADFAKIFVITYLDELKDAFPTRIEVEKTETGSTVTVM